MLKLIADILEIRTFFFVVVQNCKISLEKVTTQKTGQFCNFIRIQYFIIRHATSQLLFKIHFYLSR